MRALLVSAALLLTAAPAFAEEAKPACPAEPVLSGPFTHWLHAAPVKATADTAGAPALSIGKPVKVTLLDSTRVAYKRARATPPATPTYSGTLTFTVVQARTYGIAAGTGVWIDVVKDGETLKSSKHGHGPDCSGVRKIVDFDLQPGAYEVRLIDNKTADVTIMVLKR
ncbi:hypothetical protein [Asticcacaulis sp. AND118]|uniref:hypothetical protein n=1 Tax=Asticcacaulis sp. AND118 TaxID=2840468 RepID=UPI001CFFB09A|nr:hypothetical protein [Asticcacaulis sp. AND118]UDF04360.1 hypothetical protein LH365_04785 [Asticcacaulis sp. AND118]